MTVKQLIEELQKLDPEKMVVTAGYEGGYQEISGVGEIRLKLNVNVETWYYGAQLVIMQDDEGNGPGVISVESMP